jgi:sugar phosphate isomerase/epimerase
MSEKINRRRVLHGAAATLAAASGVTAVAQDTQPERAERVVTNGRIRQSVVFWCFNTAGERWSLDRTCEVARQLGLTSVELIPPADWGTLRRHELTCAIAPNGMPGAPYMRGFNNRQFHEELLDRGRRVLDACAEARVPSMIAFAGYKYRDPDNPRSEVISRDEATENCVRGLRELCRHADQRNVNVCIEHLNSRDTTHPMKGHPGYQGDDLDWIAEVVRRVDSPRMKILFDIYHVQIMHGDVIRRIDQLRGLIGHVHTAGNPGRGELDDRQEINYAPIMRKLVEIDYRGYVGQEFIPTRNPLEGLRQAVRLCDV